MNDDCEECSRSPFWIGLAIALVAAVIFWFTIAYLLREERAAREGHDDGRGAAAEPVR